MQVQPGVAAVTELLRQFGPYEPPETFLFLWYIARVAGKRTWPELHKSGFRDYDHHNGSFSWWRPLHSDGSRVGSAL